MFLAAQCFDFAIQSKYPIKAKGIEEIFASITKSDLFLKLV
jgi:hypothetical protein